MMHGNQTIERLQTTDDEGIQLTSISVQRRFRSTQHDQAAGAGHELY